MILVTLRKGNHSSEGPKKNFIQKREGLFRGAHEEAEIQRKALRRGKNLACSEDTCLGKERVRTKMIPRKTGVGLKRRRELSRRSWAGG